MNIFKKIVKCFRRKKKIVEFITISESDDVYKIYCEYRYQSTTVLYLEKVKLLSTLDTMNGAVNLYLSGATTLLSFFAVFLGLCSLGFLGYGDLFNKSIKYIGIYVGICTIFFLSMAPYFYSVVENRRKRVGVIEYILACRRDITETK